MALLAAAAYDPSTLATVSTTALLAMTAIDTTNLRVSFSVPPSGNVLVRLRGTIKGAATSPQVLFGVLEGSTLRGRQAPITGKLGASANALLTAESCYVVTGLTPGSFVTWDAAYGVEFAVASTAINIGGPNNTTANDAAGGFFFEVWEAVNLLAATVYDPATLQSKATSAALAITALDTTNLRLTFNAPSTGRVIVKMRGPVTGATGYPAIFLAVLESATVVARAAPIGGASDVGALAATGFVVYETVTPVLGLTPGSSHTWDAAYGVETVAASSNLVYGGPNNTTQADAGGGFAFEIWAA